MQKNTKLCRTLIKIRIKLIKMIKKKMIGKLGQ